MMKKKKNNNGIIGLIFLLFFVLIGGMLFIGATSGWFDDAPVVLDEEYYNGDNEYMNLGIDQFESLINEKKSFLVMVDQGGCTTADRLRDFVKKYMEEKNISVYKMMFDEVKKTSLGDYVKYYPSVVIVDKGKVRGYLKADADEDSDAYNDYGAFLEWINKYL